MEMEPWRIAEHKLTLYEKIDDDSQDEVYRGELETPDGIKVVSAKKLLLGGIDKSSLNSDLDKLRRMNCPFITKFVGAVLIGEEQVILVSEWAEKGQLNKHLRRLSGKNVSKYDPLITQSAYLPDRLFFKWALQASLAVKYINQQQILNEDIIKSHNFLISDEDNLKLCANEIAEEILGENSAELQLETLQWIAPENSKEDVAQAFLESIIFSLGLVILELIIGKKPFDGAEDVTIGKVAGKETIRPKIPERVSSCIKNLVESCLDTDSKKRPDIQKVIDVIQDEWLQNPG